jgi:proline iminopeptidase
LENAGKLSGIRGIVVQGRYDLLCPPSTAHALLKAWPDAVLRMVEAAGHSLYDPGVRDAVIAAIDDVSRA